MGDRWHRKGSFKERLLQVILVATQIGSHLPPSPAVQAVTTRTSTGGRENSRTSVEHTTTNDLGLECRCTVEQNLFSSTD